MDHQPCLVLMPFGRKLSGAGHLINFDAIYQELIAPAIRESGLEPLRADEEMMAGILNKPMFERLIFCEYAVADLTIADANVFYELGIRHAVRPWSTIIIFAEGSGQIVFDVATLRVMAYQLTQEDKIANIEIAKTKLAKRLLEAKEVKNSAIDSPIFQLVEGFPGIDYTKTDKFRNRVQDSARFKEQISTARKRGKQALLNLEKQLGDIRRLEYGVIIDLFLSYRAVEAWSEMIDLIGNMPPNLAKRVMLQEQLALALNRIGKGEEAEKILLDLLEKHGPSSETYGILGRVYKDRWEAAYTSGDELLAAELLHRAIEAYVHGFEADWRDAYPGINAVTLMEIREPPDPRRTKLIPIVEYAVDRRIATGRPDYWDYATSLELAVLARDKYVAIESVANALALLREPWEAETTIRNLRRIHEARKLRQDTVEWTKQLEQALEKRIN